MLTTSFGNFLRRLAALLLLVTLGSVATIEAQTPVAVKAAPVAVSCRIAGADTVKAGTTASFTGHPCALANWTASCGTVIARSDSGITICFNSASCKSAVIAAGGVSKTVTILAAPAMAIAAITPATQTIPYNTIPTHLSASTGKGGLCDGVFSYQWYASTDSVHFSKIPGATGKDYPSGALSTTTYFRRLDSCAISGTVTSGIASVHVTPRPAVVVTQPPLEDSQPQVSAGKLLPIIDAATADSLSPLLVCVEFGGGNGTYNFQWYRSTDGNNWALLPGVTTPGYCPGLVTGTTWFRVTVSSSGNSATTPSAVIYLNSKQ